MASKCIPNSLNSGRSVHFKVELTMASMCVSKQSQLQPPRLHNHGQSLCISKLGQSRPRSASLSLFCHGLIVYLQAHSIMASWFWTSLHLKVYVQTVSIMASEWISGFNRTSSSGAPRTALKHCLPLIQIIRLYMGSYMDAWIHRYIDENTNWIHEFKKLLNYQ